MQIMPVSGNDFGLTSKSLRQLEAALGVKEDEDFALNSDAERYYDSLMNLSILSETELRKEDQEKYDDAGQLRGHSAISGVELLLEGVVFALSSISDARLKAIVADDLEKWGIDDDKFRSATSEVESGMAGDISMSSHAEVVEFHRNEDGTANVKVKFSIFVESGESAYDAAQRVRDDRGESEHDLWNVMRGDRQ